MDETISPIEALAWPSSQSDISVTFEPPQRKMSVELRHPITFKLVQKALNGNTDPYIVELIGKRRDKNKSSSIYPELQRERIYLEKIYETPMDSTRDLLVRYIIRELIDERAHMRQQKQKERDEKHTIAIVGAATAVVTTIITAITTYFASK